jgi:hypothetical protein
MLTVVVIFFQRIYHCFDMDGVTEEVRIRDVNEQGFEIMLLDIVGIGFLDGEQVIVRDHLFVGAVSFLYILLQFIHG